MERPVPASPFSAPLTTLQAGVRHRQLSVPARIAWRRLGAAALTTAAMLVVGRWTAVPGQLLAAVLGTAAVVLLTRVLTADCSWPRFWRVALLCTGALVWIPGASSVGQVLFLIVAVAFLWLRRYRVYASFTSRRRAVVFLGAIVGVISLLVTGSPADRVGAWAAVPTNVHQAARVFVTLFATFTLVTLFLHLRLHFLRLRPKLAVAGLLIAAVPVVLISALGMVGLYGAIGGVRATQARAVLLEWLSLLEQSPDRAPIFGPALASDGTEAALRSRLADALALSAEDSLPPAFFLRDAERLWAVVTASDGGRVRVDAIRQVNATTMAQLADHVGCGVRFVGNEESEHAVTLGGIRTGTDPLGTGEQRLFARPSSAIADSQDAWYAHWILFGGATVDAYLLNEDELQPRKLLLSLDTRLVDLWNTFAAGENEVNQAVLLALFVVGLLFLVLQALALYFGLRIAGGITVAVGTLHKATQRLARGDLGATIDLPNEDEFGDLADSFNDMTRAIRVAQEQLVQKQVLEQEIVTARRIQERLLPHTMPELAGYQIAGSSTPSKMIGGDYFDFLPLDEGRLGIAVADVSGKGIPAALLMSNLQASLQGQALHEGSIAEMVERMNEQLARSTDDHMFATFFYAVLDPSTGRVTGVNAGHDPAMIVRADGSVERLSAGGLLLGMLPGQSYRECETLLGPGDVFVLYTDGITEAMGPRTRIPGMPIVAGPAHVPDREDEEDEDSSVEEIVTDFFEEHRLRSVVIAHRHESADEIRRSVLAAVERHTQGVPQSDDITLVVLKRVAAVPALAPPARA